MRQEFAAISLDGQRQAKINTKSFSNWLLKNNSGSLLDFSPDRKANELTYEILEKKAFERLGSQSIKKLVPDGIQWVSGAWLDN